MAWAIISLPVPDSPRISTVVLVVRDLGHLLVDRLHRPAVADDVAEVVALLQLLAELAVLLDEPLALRFHQPLHADGVADHGGDDAEELHLALEALVLVIRQGHAQRAHRRRRPR